MMPCDWYGIEWCGCDYCDNWYQNRWIETIKQLTFGAWQQWRRIRERRKLLLLIQENS